jgi:outer membrane receptor protein involved in Fe transport
MKLLHHFTITLFIAFCFSLQAQDHPSNQSPNQMPQLAPGMGMVVGSITDENAQPVQYAIIYLFASPDSVTVETAITDADGRFAIHPIPYGNYYLEIQFMGYHKHNSNTFTVNEKNPIFRLSRFKLSQKSTQLGTVEVKAQKEMIQTNLDKKVYNVEASIITDGATAIEALSEIPSLDVDIEGNVSLRGSGNVTILVDGRPTNLTLDQIPASQIESIEVITNPSARLEPDGMSGIINVILRKKREHGLNALFGLGGGFSLYRSKLYPENTNAFVNLNYSFKKINIYTNYNFRIGNSKNGGDLNRTSWFYNDTTQLVQETERVHHWMRHNVKLNLDYFINSKNTLSFSVGYNYNSGKDTNIMFSKNFGTWANEDIQFNEYNQWGADKRTIHNFNGNLNYKKTFNKKGMELTSDVYYTQMNGYSSSAYLQNFSFPVSKPDYYQNTKTTTLNRTATAQVDFVTPVGNGGRIETGYKFSYRSIGQDYSLSFGEDASHLQEDVLQRNNFEYREFLNAAYFIYSNTFWQKLKIQLGLRGEIANTFSDLKSADTVYKKQYLNLFPTAHIRYDFNDYHYVQLSYSQRVTRPNFWNLNPFVDISDKQNIRMGNPNLMPEFAHNIELGYNAIVEKSNFTVTLFYRIRTDLMTRYTEMKYAQIKDELIYYELIDGQIYTTPVISGFDTLNTFPYTLTSTQNINKSQNFGLEFVYGQRLWKFWRITLSSDFYRVMIHSEQLIDENLRNDFVFGIRLNQTFNLPKGFDVQLNFRFRSKSITTGSMGGGVGQGKQNASYSLNFGIKKSFLKNTLTLSLNIRNLINNPTILINTFSSNPVNGYNADSKRYRSAFQTNLTLTYKLNNYKVKRESNRDIDTMEQEFTGE